MRNNLDNLAPTSGEGSNKPTQEVKTITRETRLKLEQGLPSQPYLRGNILYGLTKPLVFLNEPEEIIKFLEQHLRENNIPPFILETSDNSKIRDVLLLDGQPLTRIQQNRRMFIELNKLSYHDGLNALLIMVKGSFLNLSQDKQDEFPLIQEALQSKNL